MSPIVLWRGLWSSCEMLELFDVDGVAVSCDVMICFLIAFCGDAACNSECVHDF